MPDEVELDSGRLVVVVEQSMARRHRAMAEALDEIEPDSAPVSFDLLDGVVACFGPGLFVNHAMAVGLSAPVAGEDLDRLERTAIAVGVPPGFETVDDHTPTEVIRLLDERGYVAGDATSVLICSLSELSTTEPLTLDITDVVDGDVDEWAELSAEGWGHVEPAPRSANDRFARIAHRSGTPGLLIARDAQTGRGVACADLHIDADVAILGGASTIPSERDRGAQTELVQYRLRTAGESGATIAVATTEPSSQSERNLIRLGFVRSHTKRVWRRGG